MFGLKKVQEEKCEVPATLTVTGEDLALDKLKRAESNLDKAAGALQEFTQQNLRVVAGGLIYYSAHRRDELDEQLKLLTIAYDQALTVFHSAQDEWSQQKMKGR